MTRLLPMLLLTGCAVSVEPAACPAPPVGTYMATHAVEVAECGALGPYAAPMLLPDGWWSGIDTDATCVRERTHDPAACEVVVAAACAWDGGSLSQRTIFDLRGAPETMTAVEEVVRDDGAGHCEDRGSIEMERMEP